MVKHSRVAGNGPPSGTLNETLLYIKLVALYITVSVRSIINSDDTRQLPANQKVVDTVENRVRDDVGNNNGGGKWAYREQNSADREVFLASNGERKHQVRVCALWKKLQ